MMILHNFPNRHVFLKPACSLCKAGGSDPSNKIWNENVFALGTFVLIQVGAHPQVLPILPEYYCARPDGDCLHQALVWASLGPLRWQGPVSPMGFPHF